MKEIKAKVLLRSGVSGKGNQYNVLQIQTGEQLIDINIKGVFINKEVAELLAQAYTK